MGYLTLKKKFLSNQYFLRLARSSKQTNSSNNSIYNLYLFWLTCIFNTSYNLITLDVSTKYTDYFCRGGRGGSRGQSPLTRRQCAYDFNFWLLTLLYHKNHPEPLDLLSTLYPLSLLALMGIVTPCR